MVYSNLEDFVTEIHRKIGILTPNEIDMQMIADSLNIKPHFWDESSQATESAGEHRIFINEILSLMEQWQDFGHELCHVLQYAGNQHNLPLKFRLYQEV